MTIAIPTFAILIGTSGSGTSTFAQRHFKPTEVLSSDTCRAMVVDDENDLSATGDAFSKRTSRSTSSIALPRLSHTLGHFLSPPGLC